MTSQADDRRNAQDQEPPTRGPGVKWQGKNAILTPSREHILGAFVMFLMCLMFTGYDVAKFFWVPLLPLAFMAWTLYVRTVVGPEGIGARYLFRKNQMMTWEEFSAIQFNNSGRAYAVARDAAAEQAIREKSARAGGEHVEATNETSADDAAQQPQVGGAKRLTAEENRKPSATQGTEKRFWLPGVSFNSLITLSIASEGRIPDPVTTGRDTADKKVQVVHKDGYAVLMDQDEYADYERQRRAEEAEKQAHKQGTNNGSTQADRAASDQTPHAAADEEKSE